MASTNVKIYLTLRPLVDSSGEVGSVSVVDITRVRPIDPKGFVLEVGLNVLGYPETSSYYRWIGGVRYKYYLATGFPEWRKH